MPENVHLGEGWQAAPLAANEPERLASLRYYRILDTTASDQFDNITQLVARQLNTEISLVSLVDECRQWFKSAYGTDASETPRDMAFCAHAIYHGKPLIVPDTTQDARFRGNPLVTGAPHIRFYAGMPLRAPDGQYLGTLCAIDSKPRDGLTDNEFALLTSLARIVVDEIELHRANLELAEQSRSKSIFLTNMSHEIRTPMNGVIGSASLLQQTELSDEQAHYTDTILRSGELLLEIINDILDISKIEADQLSLEATAFDLPHCLQELITLLKPRTIEKALELRLDCPGDIPHYVISDPLRIRQILLNLASNAIKFTHEGHVCLRVRCLQQNDQAAMLRFEVEDTGIGINAALQQKIFEDFIQAEIDTTREYGGTGLGLSICRHLVTMLGGTLGVHSVPEQGSTFWVEMRLPIAQETPQAAAESSQSAGAADILQNKQVLIAEDNVVNQMVLHQILLKLGCVPTIAQDGEEALAMARSNHYDIILMDCHMPKMDGYAVTHALRRETAGPQPLIIALTANALSENRGECLQAGMDDFLSKPVRQDELAATLAHWLAARQTPGVCA